MLPFNPHVIKKLRRCTFDGTDLALLEASVIGSDTDMVCRLQPRSFTGIGCSLRGRTDQEAADLFLLSGLLNVPFMKRISPIIAQFKSIAGVTESAGPIFYYAFSFVGFTPGDSLFIQ